MARRIGGGTGGNKDQSAHFRLGSRRGDVAFGLIKLWARPGSTASSMSSISACKFRWRCSFALSGMGTRCPQTASISTCPTRLSKTSVTHNATSWRERLAMLHMIAVVLDRPSPCRNRSATCSANATGLEMQACASIVQCINTCSYVIFYT